MHSIPNWNLEVLFFNEKGNQERTSNVKFNPHMMLMPGFKPRPHFNGGKFLVSPLLIIRGLSKQQWRWWLRKCHWKMNSRCFKLYRTYSILFNSSNVGKIFWRWILKDCIKVQEKKKKVVVLCSHPWQNVKLGTFKL